MKRLVKLLVLTSGLLLLTLLISPAQAAPAAQATPTYKACHICDEALPQPVVHAVLFWMNGCPHCHEVLDNVLPPLQKKYGEQLDVLLVEVVGMEDVNRLYDIAATYGFSRDQVGVPFLIIGDQALVGSQQIPEELPGLIEKYLAQGGVEVPDSLRAQLPAAVADPPCLQGEDCAALTSTPGLPADMDAASALPAEATPVHPDGMRSNGFTLAIIVMGLMVAALLYSIIAFSLGKAFSLPTWADWIFPILIIIGIGVAGYLTYVEAQQVSAICGPVGDCNAVQGSRYARLFDVLPVSMLGMFGYLAILGAWLVSRRDWGRISAFYAPLAVFGMAFFGVLFSLYLTYLEPFVIHAVCMWCVTSAVIMTLLLLFSLAPATRTFEMDGDEEYNMNSMRQQS